MRTLFPQFPAEGQAVPLADGVAGHVVGAKSTLHTCHGHDEPLQLRATLGCRSLGQ